MDLVAVECALQVERREPPAAANCGGEVFDAGQRMSVCERSVVEASQIDAESIVVDGPIGILFGDHEGVA